MDVVIVDPIHIVCVTSIDEDNTCNDDGYLGENKILRQVNIK